MRKIIVNEPFLRGYTIPVEVGGDAVLLQPYEVFKLYREGRVVVEKGGKEIGLKAKADAVELARALSLGEPVRVRYLGTYDAERGLVADAQA